MPAFLDVTSRYPGNDPENGPACRHIWDGHQWVEASCPWEPRTDTKEGYHQFTTGAGSFQVFWDDGNEEPELFPEPGWYWWACFPGCLPDGEPSGPFATSQDAFNDAQGED